MDFGRAWVHKESVEEWMIGHALRSKEFQDHSAQLKARIDILENECSTLRRQAVRLFFLS